MDKKALRDEISKTLVKWNMPTRQVAINDIMQLIDKYVVGIIDAPIRAGDRMPGDEIIEDGVREALVRVVQREAAGLK